MNDTLSAGSSSGTARCSSGPGTDTKTVRGMMNTLLDVCLFATAVYLTVAVGLLLIEDVNATAEECGNCTALAKPQYGYTERFERMPLLEAEVVHTGPPRTAKCTIYERAIVCDKRKTEVVG